MLAQLYGLRPEFLRHAYNLLLLLRSAIRFTWAWHPAGEEKILPGSLRLIDITLSQLMRTCVVTLVTGRYSL